MTETYKKNDYLTPTQYATRYNVPADVVKAAVEKAWRDHTSIKQTHGGVLHEIIIGNHGKRHIRPEPMAHEKLNEIIKQIQGQQK
ncbi:MAG: hypothetical protein II179_02400 [Alphaproteobacteria bacterium]|jgi:hypothetical protein|nr:hypothetical protein [Alphaproteobacteria bacterium]